jgi:hypothetical protein
MSIKHNILFAFALLLSITSFAEEVKKNKYKTEHVIILVLDGPRWSETYGDSTYQYVKHMQEELVPKGVFFNNFTNEGPTYTLSGHTAITTGVYQKLENTGKKVPKNPSIFQYYLKQHQADKRKAWILTSKGKLNVIGHTKHKDWLRQYYPSVYSGANGSGRGYPSDIKQFPIFKDIIAENLPAITLINLLDIDAWAHQGRWDEYIRSLIQNDKLTVELWKFIESTPGLRGKTSLFITNDHGRHLDEKKNGFISHGDNCYGCKKISLIGLGPDFKVNTTVDTPYDLIDINATAAELMNVDVPTSKGEVMWEMFKNCETKNVEQK